VVRRPRLTFPAMLAGRRLWAAASVVLLVVAVVALWFARPWDRLRRDEVRTVQSYIADFNSGDPIKLSRDIFPSTTAHARQLLASANRPWQVREFHVAHDFGPKYAVAEVFGESPHGQLHVYLPMLLIHRRWYVTAKAEGGSQTSPNPPTGPPTAATTRPGS
jgi:hypothetical protein